MMEEAQWQAREFVKLLLRWAAEDNERARSLLKKCFDDVD